MPTAAELRRANSSDIVKASQIMSRIPKWRETVIMTCTFIDRRDLVLFYRATQDLVELYAFDTENEAQDMAVSSSTHIIQRNEDMQNNLDSYGEPQVPFTITEDFWK